LFHRRHSICFRPTEAAGFARELKSRRTPAAAWHTYNIFSSPNAQARVSMIASTLLRMDAAAGRRCCVAKMH
jgi:hypothetical protein